METHRNRRPQPVAAPFLIGLALMTLTSCESLTGVAPADTPRVEIELAVVVNDAFVEPFVDVDEESELFAAVRDAVRAEADLGLRFYPTPSEEYGENDKRPPYLMTVNLDQLSLVFDHEMIEEEGEEPRVEASVDTVVCSVSASIENRREDAPSLIVATAKSSSDIAAETDAEDLAAGQGYTPKFEGADLKVLEKDIVKAVQTAVDRALKSMRTPIDREFAPEPTAEATSEASQE